MLEKKGPACPVVDVGGGYDQTLLPSGYPAAMGRHLQYFA